MGQAWPWEEPPQRRPRNSLIFLQLWPLHLQRNHCSGLPLVFLFFFQQSHSNLTGMKYYQCPVAPAMRIKPFSHDCDILSSCKRSAAPKSVRSVHFPNDIVFQDYVRQGELEGIGRFIRARRVSLDTIYLSGEGNGLPSSPNHRHLWVNNFSCSCVQAWLLYMRPSCLGTWSVSSCWSITEQIFTRGMRRGGPPCTWPAVMASHTSHGESLI